ncbi:MAG TPA: N-acetylmuramoyl-L-alanine amidase [Bryobacteraceae bacterium]|nr:N-acetylmuramoyl-L-alanine amidase [Bryobacteraceae bacterium]
MRSAGACLRVVLALWLGSGLLAAQPGEQSHVTAVRFWSLGDVTRIAVETDGEFQVRSDHLSNPDRIFFDLVGAKPALGQSLTVIPVSDKLLHQIRVAAPQKNVTRVVLDMAGAAEASTSRLENPNRLIIELRPSAHPGEAPAPDLALVARRRFNPPPAAQAALASKKTETRLETPPVVETSQPVAPAAISAKLSASTLRPGPPPFVRPSVPNSVSPPASTPSAAAPPSGGASPSASSASAVAAATVLAKLSVPPMASPGLSSASAAAASSAISKPGIPASSASSPTAASPAETALPAKRNATGDRSMIRVLGLKLGRIVIDAGHGGHDTGTIGPEGLREKDLVLDVSRRLGALIEERMGSEVIYTRTDDTFIPLERRTEIANEAKADLFLSIHANSSPMRSAAGVETYYLNFTTSKSALEVAARENSGSQETIYELQDLLQKIALKDKVEESREFASRVQTAMFALSAKTNAHSKDRGVKKAPFVVLIGATMPSVLAEIGFISNAQDERAMRRPDHRQRIAEALYKGLSSYAGTLSHFQVAQRQ